MAYVPNQLSCIAQTIEGNFNEYILFGTDSLATVIGVNYISDGQKRGMELGNVVWYNNGTTTYLLQVTAAQANTSGYGVTLAELSSGTGTGVAQTNTAISTVGAGTLTAAAIVGGVITRTGSTGAFTDTTDTAANIIAAMNSDIIGNSWTLRIVNNTAYAETIAAGTGVTLSGSTIVPANSWLEFLVTYSATGAVTMYGYEVGANVVLPPTKYTTGALTAATLTAAQIAGAAFTVLNNSGATPGAQTLPAAAVLFAAIPNAQVGMSYLLRIVNSGSGTLTFTDDAGTTITLTGHTSILTDTFVDYIVTFTSATAATIQSIGAGTAP